MYNFLDQVIGDYHYSIQFGTTKDCDGAPACISESDYDVIIINKYLFYQYTVIEQKAILLHEAGHIVIGDLKNPTATEYHAHLWAMSEAKKQGWKGLYKELEATIISWAHSFEWNEDDGAWRQYIRAGRKYLKRKYERRKIKKTLRVRSKNTKVGR